MRKVYIDLQVTLQLNTDNEDEVSEIISELDYDFSDTTGKATVEDSEISDYEVTVSGNVDLTVGLILVVDDKVEVSEIVNELDYEFKDLDDKTIKSEIKGHEVTDSK
jgi:hypothetical protein|tara:strand:- start:260 stop:580 length:321 start_codon:yes stop_codon:yes gene_type:complete